MGLMLCCNVLMTEVEHGCVQFFLTVAPHDTDSTDWATRATRVEGSVEKVGDRHICRGVPQVAQPNVHVGLGGHPVLQETTSAALLLTVEGDGEGVAHEQDADPGDLTNWQGALGIASNQDILAAHLLAEPRAARLQPESRDVSVTAV